MCQNRDEWRATRLLEIVPRWLSILHVNARNRRPTRLEFFDYCAPGAYFVTICTHGRVCLLDEPQNRLIAQQVWRHLARRSNHGRPEEFVAMPNHVHAIIWISEPNVVGAQHASLSPRHTISEPHRETNRRSGYRRAAPLRGSRGICLVLPGSLGAVVRAYKSAVARRVNEVRGTPGAPVWQRGYHERVIRNERELNAVRQYILDNPPRWAEDRFNPPKHIART